jgi:hypothetical protein
MRQFALLVAGTLLFAIGTTAQETSQTSSLFLSPFGETSFQPNPTQTTTMSLSLASFSLTSPPPDSGPRPSASAAEPAPAEPPQVFGVKPTFAFQGYLGYTFLRFYEVPSTNVNTNGFNYSIVYFPALLKNWIGADGEFVLTLGSQYPYEARFLLGMGGARFRWAPTTRANIELWAHGLFGASHYVPQTPYGPQGAFGYEVGGGIDINARRRRYAYRFGADMIATHFFGTYQFSPKISAGFVYKF